MPKFILAAALALVAPMVAAQSPYVTELKGVEAKFVPDGDTAQISVRLFGIDTPESDQLCERPTGSCYRCGERAGDVLEGMIKGQKATYRFTGDITHGRTVATVFIGLKDINREMVRQGHAVVFPDFLPKDMRDDYFDAQKEAKKNKRGIWNGKFIEPRKWRKGERLACE